MGMNGLGMPGRRFYAVTQPAGGMARAYPWVHFFRADAARSSARRGRTQGFGRVPKEGSGMRAGMPHSVRRMRSGARRSQEQGESRMTVLPGARNRVTGTKSRGFDRGFLRWSQQY